MLGLKLGESIFKFVGTAYVPLCQLSLCYNIVAFFPIAIIFGHQWNSYVFMLLVLFCLSLPYACMVASYFVLQRFSSLAGQFVVLYCSWMFSLVPLAGMLGMAKVLMSMPMAGMPESEASQRFFEFVIMFLGGASVIVFPWNCYLIKKIRREWQTLFHV